MSLLILFGGATTLSVSSGGNPPKAIAEAMTPKAVGSAHASVPKASATNSTPKGQAS